MKNITINALLVTCMLVVSSCKKDTSTPISTTNIEIEPPVELDSLGAKKEVEAEKEKLSKPYNEQEDAQEKLNELIAQAKSTGKNVFVQAGGNWCIWCLRFNDFVQKDEELKTLVDANFLYYHLNYSSKNKNAEVFSKYAPNAKEMGYPFFFVIDGNGKVINIFASGDLEAEKSYDREKVKQMFLAHAPKK